MSKNTSILLENYSDQFVQGRINEGRFKNGKSNQMTNYKLTMKTVEDLADIWNYTFEE